MGISFSVNMTIMNYFKLVNFGGDNFIYVLGLLMAFLLFYSDNWWCSLCDFKN